MAKERVAEAALGGGIWGARGRLLRQLELARWGGAVEVAGWAWEAGRKKEGAGDAVQATKAWRRSAVWELCSWSCSSGPNRSSRGVDRRPGMLLLAEYL